MTGHGGPSASVSFTSLILMICRTLKEQDCSYQGEALNVPTAFKVLWSCNNKH